MLLAIDIGNTTANFGVFDGDSLVSTFAIPTVRDQKSEDIYALIKAYLEFDLSGVIISSVVPELEIHFLKLFKTHFGSIPNFIDSSFDFGFSINYLPPESCGTDRLVDAFAAKALYGLPCIVCDLGTATTIDAVNSKNEYLGGVIVPGVKTLVDSLFEKTSKLPKIEIAKPKKVIGNSTVSSIQSGVYYGYLGLVDGIIERMIAELGEKPVVVATGGFSGLIAENSKFIEIVNRDLLLVGLRMLHDREINR